MAARHGHVTNGSREGFVSYAILEQSPATWGPAIIKILNGNFAGGFRVIGNTVTNGRFVGATFDSNGLFQYFGMYG